MHIQINRFLKKIHLSNIECPTELTISHCKTVNKIQKTCKKCHSNYYLKNNNEYLAYSKLN